MSIEKEKYLKVATPEQWDWWLTLKADANASYEKNDWHVKELMKFRDEHGFDCLFCMMNVVKSFFPNSLHTYVQDCKVCMGGNKALCLLIDQKDRVDKAIERLEKVGLWDD